MPTAIHQKTAFANFDKTYAIDHETLTVLRRVEVLQKKVPAADWKAYKKWMDATVNEGEPFIQLTTTDAKSGEKGPPKAGTNNAEAARLVKEGIEEIQRGEVNKAEKTLAEARGSTRSRPGCGAPMVICSSSGGDGTRQWRGYRKELELYPDTYWVYGAMSQAQVNGGHFAAAVETMLSLLKLTPTNDAVAKLLVGMLMGRGEYAQALPVLDALVVRLPEDADVRAQLGIAQMKTGKITEGKATLVAALPNANDSEILNSGSYELADAGIELEAAEKSGRKAVDLLTAESADWTPGQSIRLQPAKQQVMVAAWDTLGWAIYKEGRVDEAEGYIRAAWLNGQQPEEGLHLGEIQEKQGHDEAALKVYEMAVENLRHDMSKDSTKKLDPVAEKLHERVDALRKKGTKSGRIDAKAGLQKLRTLPVGRSAGRSGFVEYAFVLSGGRAVELQKGMTQGTELADGDAMVRKADLGGRTPPGSSARLLRKGTLNCHSAECEFIVHP